MSYSQQPDGVFETIEQIKKDQEETQKYLNEITEYNYCFNCYIVVWELI